MCLGREPKMAPQGSNFVFSPSTKKQNTTWLKTSDKLTKSVYRDNMSPTQSWSGTQGVLILLPMLPTGVLTVTTSRYTISLGLWFPHGLNDSVRLLLKVLAFLSVESLVCTRFWSCIWCLQTATPALCIYELVKAPELCSLESASVADSKITSLGDTCRNLDATCFLSCTFHLYLDVS